MLVKKKATKKTYSAAKKAFPKKKITFDDLTALVANIADAQAKTEASIDRLSATHAKTEASIDRLSATQAKTEAAIQELSTGLAKGHAKTEAAIDRLSAENEKTLVAVKEASVRSEKAIAEIHASQDRMEDSFGGVSKRLGDLAEIIVVPKIRMDINKLGGHNFQEAAANKKIVAAVDGVKGVVTEVDMLLFGDGEAMAVEIKAHLKKTKVDTHIQRLQKLRNHEEEAGIVGKKLFGAVVDVIVDEEAKKHAKKNGLYVIEIREEEGKLDIEKPDTCRTW